LSINDKVMQGTGEWHHLLLYRIEAIEEITLDHTPPYLPHEWFEPPMQHAV